VALSILGNREGLSLLSAGLQSADAFTCWEAAYALGRVYDEESISALSDVLHRDDPDVAGEAALSLGKIGDRRAVPALLKVLDSPHSEVRMRTAMALGKLKDKSALAELQKRIRLETDPLAQNAVEQAVARLQPPARTVQNSSNDRHKSRDAPARPQPTSRKTPSDSRLIELSTTELLQLFRGGSQTKRAVRKELMRRGADALPQLIEATTDTSFVVRWEAVNALGTIGDLRALEVLATCILKDENVHVRWRSIWAINSLDRALVIPRLARGLQSSNAEVVWNSAVALSVFDIRDGLAVLQEGLQSSNGFTRWEAANALGRVHDERAAPALVAVLEANDPRAAGEAALSLGKIGARDAVPALIKALSSPHAGVRTRAAAALARMRERTAVAELESCLAIETDELAREALERAVAKLALPSQ
jgi:HEAT repeat protein